MLELIAALGIPLFKLIAGWIMGKKLNDKEFQLFIADFQDRKKRSGKVATDWRDELKRKIKEIEESESE